MKRRFLLTMLLLSSLTIDERVYGLEKVVVDTGISKEINNVVFDSNTGTQNGASVFNKGNATILNTTFKNNNAPYGAVYNQAAMQVKNSEFISNTGTDYAGGLTAYFMTALDIDNTKFVGNKSEHDLSAGALYVSANSSSVTTTITNSVFSENSSVNASGWGTGGAIGLGYGKLSIDNTEFNNNRSDLGGAIMVFAPSGSETTADRTLTITNSKFSGNEATYYGGGIITSSDTYIDNVEFVGNTAGESGGAILSEGYMSIENSLFQGNSATSQVTYGGAIYNEGEMIINNSEFIGNNAANGYGGAIYTVTDMIIADTNFINNSADVQGGAIYAEGDLTIAAQLKDVLFDGNTSKNLEDGCDIYMGTAGSKLSFNIAEGKTVTLNGGISGTEGGYNIVVNETSMLLSGGSNSGTLNINSYVKNANIDVSNATLALGADADVSDVSQINITNGGLDTANGVADSFDSGLFNLSGNVGINADVNINGDAIGGDNLRSIVASNTSANVTITGINVTGNTTANNLTIDVKSALGLDGLDNVTVDTSSNFTTPDMLTPIRYLRGSIDESGVVSYAPRGNGFGNFNPSVMVSSVAAQAGGYLNQLNTYNQAFMNLDMKMLLTKEERQAMRLRNSYVSTATPQVFSPTYLAEKENAAWVRPYASFEKVNFDGGPKVNNVMYGTFLGGDSEMYELKNGAQGQLSFYAGYNGSHQTFSGNSIYQNGGTLGLTGIVYKDNFFTALTANTGASVADASTMYGSEDIPMLMAGVASKTGYNWELAKGKFIVQPSYLMSYTFVNTFDYTNAAGVRIESSPLHAIQIAPGVKFIGNLPHGWQPYINLRMVWNLMDKTEFTAANTALPQLSTKPYFEYGLGVQKRWGERFTGFGQAMLRAGGRTGIGMGFGFRLTLGKAPTKSYNQQNPKKIVQAPSIKLSNIK